MELNVDYTVTARMSAEEKIEYSNCLLKVAKIQVLHRQIELSHLGITFNDEKTTTISKRIISIMHAMEKPAKTALVSCFVIFAVGSIFLLSSFCFILEPSSIPELVEEKTFGFDSKHNFFISNEDGSYDLYIDNQYVLTVDEPFDSTATIYSNIKEVPFYEDKMQ